ncbi:MAG: hypothetical protein HEQ27_09155 [Dolichospermum sp. JUN01]|nr:hypothetical protein [Dolichospermum sp. JUN01]MBS9392156.1 hypothetical protein [Dolichospermum sp. OL01]MCO5795800.1 hypothetical protein [Dolichospermum sp. OL03]MCS6283554.1 hypothetical protein [Dolichospermum sp.]QSV56944.1 MAG: hypothetical protein HEQ29_03040 [Dolichospermum sp. LBC05a]
MFWSQHHLHNPTANVHYPHHEDWTIKSAISPNGRQLWFSPLISPDDKYQKDIKKLSHKKHIFLLEIEDKLCYYFPFLANALLQFKLRENQKEVREIKAFVEAISTSDLVVASGGGYITDLWGEWSHEVLSCYAAKSDIS